MVTRKCEPYKGMNFVRENTIIVTETQLPIQIN